MDQVFTAASHDDLLQLLVQIVVLLLAARLLGEVSQRFGQPAVVGEILAGILLGPSLLSGLFPFVEQWIIPQTEVAGYLLETISLLGVMFLLLITGLEIDIGLIRRQARSAVGMALGGLSFSLPIGFLLGQHLPDDLLGDPDNRFVFALFIATSMAIAAIPVVAKVLMDLNLTRRDIGQTLVAAAMIDDTTGWILLSIVIGMAAGAAVTVGTVAQSVLSVLAFLALSFTIGQWFVGKALKFVQNDINSRDKILSLVVILMFAWGTVSHALHLEALIGAFVLGILFSRLPNLDINVIHKLESIALGIFAPIFFATAGLKVDIISLLEPRLIAITFLVIGVAMFCKVVGVYTGSRLIGRRDHWTAVFFGFGLNARGSMEIIVATIGLSLGVLSQEMFSIIVVMAVATSLMAPFALRWAVGRIQAEDQELARLRQEEMNRDNIVANANRVLLPVRVRDPEMGQATQLVEARILERMGAKTPLSVTLFTVNRDGDINRGSAFLNQLSELFARQTILKRSVLGEKPADLILDEARRDYDLLVLGASNKRKDTSALFTPVVDYLMRMAPCPTILVHGERVRQDWMPRRILIPTNGSMAARRAAQVGFSLSTGDPDEEIIILNVIEQRDSQYTLSTGDGWEERELNISDQIVGELREMGEMQGINTAGAVRRDNDIAHGILEIAREERADLIVLGTNVRAGSQRLYLGPKVERVLNNSPCPVMIVNST
jgi:Kef-type K+ transport system membrane component KefB/nucleotide-binding universal stress UspA family protein